MYRFVVVGGGTAGAITATYLKSHWGDKVDVTVVYDHKQPNIGLGESLTPTILTYLKQVGITTDELIKDCNSTVKLGLKFKNWTGDGSYFYHPFNCMDTSSFNTNNFEAAYEIANGCYDNDTAYGNDLLESNKVPMFLEDHSHALHIDGIRFSQYVLKKFEFDLNIIDDIITDVVIDENGINHLVGTNNKKIEGDFFIDASGLKKVIFSKLDNTWIDKSDWLPLNRVIPNPIPCNHDEIPSYTTAEATGDGWILQVPLRNRWGTGYLYSDRFTEKEDAQKRFDQFLKENYNSSLQHNNIGSFDSGYWKKQWIKNSMCVGLSSGFTEPLEATNIHHVIYQMFDFTSRFNFKIFDFDIERYNETMEKFYNRVYLFIRFCYNTGRRDTSFWQYLYYNTPKQILDLTEKISNDFLNEQSMPHDIFNYNNFIKVARGLDMINRKNYLKILSDRNVVEYTERNINIMRDIKKSIDSNSVSHKEYLEYR
tara:strand:+ start:69 stop:1514 length:1446 start_codon:yes stop_codon:yes gene_type:complete